MKTYTVDFLDSIAGIEVTIRHVQAIDAAHAEQEARAWLQAGPNWASTAIDVEPDDADLFDHGILEDEDASFDAPWKDS